ncbi:AAA family ATPase [Phenylobacterium sp.]|uniref:AAA family ATPase n=1 Tax=Phenylobacterium sp. TaxID=1871053 RepID=UPI003960399A
MRPTPTSNPKSPRLKVINLWAGPGAGKSTTAAALFAAMKAKGLRVELVREFAKELTYEADFMRLGNQLLILAEQHRRLDALVGQVDYAITDSPLPIGIAYARPAWRTSAFIGVVKEAWSHFDNLNYWVERVKPYQTYGRNETEAEARKLDDRLMAVASEFCRRIVRVKGDERAGQLILGHLGVTQ